MKELKQAYKELKPQLTKEQIAYHDALHKVIAKYVVEPATKSREVYEYYRINFMRQTKSNLPEYNYVRDLKCIKILLKTHSVDELKKAIDRMFENKWCRVNGYLLTFLPNELKKNNHLDRSEFHGKPNY